MTLRWLRLVRAEAVLERARGDHLVHTALDCVGESVEVVEQDAIQGAVGHINYVHAIQG